MIQRTVQMIEMKAYIGTSCIFTVDPCPGAMATLLYFQISRILSGRKINDHERGVELPCVNQGNSGMVYFGNRPSMIIFGI